MGVMLQHYPVFAYPYPDCIFLPAIKRISLEVLIMNDKAEIKRQIMDQLYAMQQKIDELNIIIAEQNREIDSFREREKDLRMITDNMRDMIAMVDKSGFFIYLSPSYKTILGYEPHEMLGKSCFNLSHPDDMERLAQTFSRAMVTEVPEHVEYRLRKADGEYLCAETIGNFIRNDKGAVTGAIISTRDFTDRRRAEEALRKSEEKYRSIFDNALYGIFQSTPDGQYISVNNSLAKICGYDSPEEMIEAITDISHQFYVNPPDREIFKQRLEEEGFLEDFEIEVYHRDGAKVWLSVNARAIKDTEGKILYYEGSNEDITARKQMEAAFSESEIKYKAIFETTGAATAIIGEDGTILMVNRELARQSGYSKEEIEGKMSFKEFLHPDDLSISVSYHAARLQGNPDIPRQYETRMVLSSGEIKNFIITVDVIPGTKMTVASLLDITELKRAGIALKDSEEKYRLLMEKADDAIMVAQDNIIKFPNPKLLSIVGYSAEEINNMPFTDLIHPDDRKMVYERYQKRMDGDDIPTSYDFRAINKWGEELLVEITAIQITWEGKPAVLCFIRDITMEKRQEAQLQHAQKMEAIGTLAGGIAHEFNNLLMGIQGQASLMLLDTETYQPHYEKLRSIEDQVRSGSNLTKQLLAMASEGKYEARPTDLNEVIEKTSEMFGRMHKELTILKKFEPNLWSAEVDRSQIEQVLLNFYVNAWQAMPQGGDLYLITQNVMLDEDFVKPYNLKAGKYVRFSVTDTGTGMDERTKERIFDPFFTTKEFGRNKGLGLASSYGIIKNHGGFVNVYSEKGHGSTFHAYLPASEREAEKALQEKGLTLKTKETILVVDDEKINITVTTEMLKALGYKVMTARSGQEAVYLYNDHINDISLIILDMVMPGMGGAETFDILKEANPDIKVILASGYGLDGQAANIMTKGIKAFIQKPFTIGALSTKIREVLDTP